MQSLFGTRTTADINLVLQILLLIGLWIGFVLARRGKIGGPTGHANVQTTMVLANLVLIAGAMGTSFYSYVIEGGSTSDSVARWMMVHGILGTIAEVTGIYLILRMRTKLIPKRLRVGNFKRYMRATLGLWTILVLLGVIIYVDRYYEVTFEVSAQRGAAAAPLAQMHQAGADLFVHAVELEDAAGRDNFPSVKRHAEHLVNLIEGNRGLHYGDVDLDGRIEDPGDGTGLLVYVERVAAAANDDGVAARAEEVEAALLVIRQNAEQIAIFPDLSEARPLIAETVSLARRTNAEGIGGLAGAAQTAGVVALPYTEPPPPGTTAPTKVIVEEDNFAFIPYELRIAPGTTVVFVNKERAKHTATSDDGLFDSGDQPMGHAYEFTFEEPGAYQYFCLYHGDKDLVGMAGVVIVEE
ncbi:MAG: plastocyanin/azurin family copper-binding protein [Thermomicrobiales bacterium]